MPRTVGAVRTIAPASIRETADCFSATHGGRFFTVLDCTCIVNLEPADLEPA